MGQKRQPSPGLWRSKLVPLKFILLKFLAQYISKLNFIVRLCGDLWLQVTALATKGGVIRVND